MVKRLDGKTEVNVAAKAALFYHGKTRYIYYGYRMSTRAQKEDFIVHLPDTIYFYKLFCHIVGKRQEQQELV